MKLNEYVKPDNRFAIYESVRNDCDPKTAAYLTEMHNGFVLPFLAHLDKYLFEAAINAAQSKQLWADLQASGAPGGKAGAPAAETPLDPAQAEQFAKKLPDATQSAPVDGFKEKAAKIIGSVKDAVAQKSLKQLAQDAIKNPTMQTLALTALSGAAGVAANALTGGSAPLVGGIVGGLMGVTKAKMQGQDWKSAAQSGLKGAAMGAAAGFIGGTAATMMGTGLAAAADQVKGATAPQQSQTPPDASTLPGGDAGMKDAEIRAANMQNVSNNIEKNSPATQSPASKAGFEPTGDDDVDHIGQTKVNGKWVNNDDPSLKGAQDKLKASGGATPQAAASTTPAPSDENPSPSPQSAALDAIKADPKMKAAYDKIVDKIAMNPNYNATNLNADLMRSGLGNTGTSTLDMSINQAAGGDVKSWIRSIQSKKGGWANESRLNTAKRLSLTYQIIKEAGEVSASTEEFIKAALAQGYSKEQIQGVLKKNKFDDVVDDAGATPAAKPGATPPAATPAATPAKPGEAPAVTPPPPGSKPGATTQADPAAPAAGNPAAPGALAKGASAAAKGASAAADAIGGAIGKAKDAVKGAMAPGEGELDKETINKIFMNLANAGALDDAHGGSAPAQGGSPAQGGQGGSAPAQGNQGGGQSGSAPAQGGGQSQGGSPAQGGGQSGSAPAQGAAPAQGGGLPSGPGTPLKKADLNKIFMNVARAMAG